MVPSMVRVPQDGAVDEVLVDRRTGRRWTVTVEPFEIATTAVTTAQWNDAAEATHSVGPGNLLPVVGISWREAITFCNRLSLRTGLTPAYTVTTRGRDATGTTRAWAPHDRPALDDWHVAWDRSADGFRLPTDAEWQLACRAGTDGPRYGPLDDIAWYDANSGGERRPVAQKQPNPWGLFDTLGGVWEWCWDLYDLEVYGAYRVIRGGGWADPHWSCRAGVRRKTSPTARLDDLGLRLARTITD
jgi:sulfatase modifying factor 1